jgi:hypothetical protein
MLNDVVLSVAPARSVRTPSLLRPHGNTFGTLLQILHQYAAQLNDEPQNDMTVRYFGMCKWTCEATWMTFWRHVGNM